MFYKISYNSQQEIVNEMLKTFHDEQNVLRGKIADKEAELQELRDQMNDIAKNGEREDMLVIARIYDTRLAELEYLYGCLDEIDKIINYVANNF